MVQVTQLAAIATCRTSPREVVHAQSTAQHMRPHAWPVKGTAACGLLKSCGHPVVMCAGGVHVISAFCESCRSPQPNQLDAGPPTISTPETHKHRTHQYLKPGTSLPSSLMSVAAGERRGDARPLLPGDAREDAGADPARPPRPPLPACARPLSADALPPARNNRNAVCRWC